MAEPSSPLSLIQALSSVPDPRRPEGRRHPLPAVPGLVAVAAMHKLLTLLNVMVRDGLRWDQPKAVQAA